MKSHTAVFMGVKTRASYYVDKGGYNKFWDEWREPQVVKDYQKIGEVEIIRVELDDPPLNQEDYIFINKISKKVRVNQKVRSTNNEFIYYVDHVVEIVEDASTEESKVKAEEELIESMEIFNKKKLESSVVEVQTDQARKKWYEIWKKTK
ncbi:hypothetical protein P4V41_07860 [Fictibacillus nanhaiensis]|uniref:hypothetical protein n=1 Tax=Fictibacillus nanhaiensis TaxID=742169 RepID=UPI002E1E677F|nr:hypothetical protein [Fictibacillus nanhaiensis]